LTGIILGSDTGDGVDGPDTRSKRDLNKNVFVNITTVDGKQQTVHEWNIIVVA
jgi:hypothetical protein